MAYLGVQMLMEKLKQLINCNDIPSINHPAIIRERPQFQLLYDELDNPMIQTLFIGQHQDLERVNDLKKRFTDAAEEAQYIIDLFLSHVLDRNDDFNPSLNLDDVWRSLESVKVEFMSMRSVTMKMDSSPRPDRTLNKSAAAAPVSFTRNSQGSKKLTDEIFVGLDRDLELIRDKLVEDRKKLDVVSIVGMGGIGKTTVATKVFNDGYVKHLFHVRVWVTVSQTYDKRYVLIQILESIRGQLHLEKDNSDSQLREMVHKQLMGKRYLIVIDDIRHTKTWDNLKVFFPHDNNRSRILLTTRLTEVAKHANSDGFIYHLGNLDKEKSWKLLCQKVFRGNECPEWSIKPGMQIVESCHGLPLAVVVVAGVLAKEASSEKLWVEIACRVSSYIVGDQNGCLGILALSYNHLPLHLRECFLYLGGFPEDYKYEVRRLIWLWVAEGFIQQDRNRSLEDIADGYLLDLIDRNLVIVAHRSKFNGVVKACKVHGLFRQLCVKKAKEEQFILETENSQISNVITSPYKQVRVFINKDMNIQDFPYPSIQNLRSILRFGDFRARSDDIAKCFRYFLLLRVLDLQESGVNAFPYDIKLLVPLRYLAIWSLSEDFPSSICNLWRLQTLVYKSNQNVTVLPNNISDLVNLRHLWSYHAYNRKKDTRPCFLPSIEKPMNLQSISYLKLGDGVHKYFPFIKELTCATFLEKENDFKSLTYLEKLNLTAITKDVRMPNRGMNRITLPATLKALTLHGCYLPWSDMSIIQSLPNLQVLKLRNDAFVGSCWNTDGQEFRQLRFLRLEKLYIKQWEVCSPSFPCLRQLEIIKCSGIEEIPLEFGEIPTLELIKIKRWPDSSFDESVRRIQQEQHDAGNYDLKIHIINSISLYVWTTDVSEDWDDYRQLQGEVNGIKYSCSIEF